MVTKNGEMAVPEQMVCDASATAAVGAGFTEMVTVKGDPVQFAVEGVTV